MCKINILLFTIIQFVLLFDNTKQYHVTHAIARLKTIGKTIKTPLFKQIANTIKNSVGMFYRNKNTMKNFACSLQENYLRTRHSFGTNSIKYLRQQGIQKFKYIAPYAVEGSKQLVRTESKKNIQMRSAAQMGGKEVRSLMNIISKSKTYLPLVLFAGGLNKLTHFNILPSDDDVDLTNFLDIENVEQYNGQDKEESGETVSYPLNNDILKSNKNKYELKRREYYMKNKDRIAAYQKEYRLKNKDKMIAIQRRYVLKNKDKIAKKRKEYILKNKDPIAVLQKEYRLKNKDMLSKLQKKNYYSNNKDKIKEKVKEYYLKNKEYLTKKQKEYQLKNKDQIAAKQREYQLKNKDQIAVRQREYQLKSKDKIKAYYWKNKVKINAKRKIEYQLKNKDKIIARLREYNLNKLNVKKRLKKQNSKINKTARAEKGEGYNPKEELAKKKREYYQKNKEKITEKRKEHYQNNIDKIIEKNTKYYEKNKENVSRMQKEYQSKNKEKIAEYKRAYYHMKSLKKVFKDQKEIDPKNPAKIDDKASKISG